MTTTPTAPGTTNPAGVGVVVSAAVKAVLIALAALGWVPITEEAIAEVTLAVAALVDVLLYFGVVKPRVNQLRAQASANHAGLFDPERTQPYRTTFRSDRDLR